MSEPDNADLEAARERRRLRLQFEETCNVMVNVHGFRGEEIFGCIIPYRDYITENVRSRPQIPPHAFVQWMESADRRAGTYPKPEAADFMESLDEILIGAVRERGMTPQEVIRVLDDWVEKSKAEAVEDWGIPPDFFDGGDP